MSEMIWRTHVYLLPISCCYYIVQSRLFISSVSDVFNLQQDTDSNHVLQVMLSKFSVQLIMNRNGR